MKKEKSCGIIVFNEDKILLVHHNKGHWGLPKGHVEENETEEETAIRETKEETNVDASIIPGFREVITYSPKHNTIKDVVFFIGKPITSELEPQEIEVSEVKFVPINKVVEIITHVDEQEVVKKALEFYKNR